MDRAKAASRVRKLVALAKDRASTEAEAESAMTKARALIEKHGLTAADLAPEPTPRRPHFRPPPRPPGSMRVSVTFNGSHTSTNAAGGAFVQGPGGVWVRIG